MVRRAAPASGVKLMDTTLSKLLQSRIETLKVLVVDDNHYMRKVVRTMLNAIGVKTVFEAPDGISGLDSLRQNNPDLVIVDWEMPMIDGAQFVRMVRSPGDFPLRHVPGFTQSTKTLGEDLNDLVLANSDFPPRHGAPPGLIVQPGC